MCYDTAQEVKYALLGLLVITNMGHVVLVGGSVVRRMEGHRPVAGWQKRQFNLVHSVTLGQYAGHPRDNLHFWSQPEKRG